MSVIVNGQDSTGAKTVKYKACLGKGNLKKDNIKVGDWIYYSEEDKKIIEEGAYSKYFTWLGVFKRRFPELEMGVGSLGTGYYGKKTGVWKKYEYFNDTAVKTKCMEYKYFMGILVKIKYYECGYEYIDNSYFVK